MQIRRTDKVELEATMHNLSEYLIWADRYYNKEEMKAALMFLSPTNIDPMVPTPASTISGLPSIKRRIFIATDDPSVIQEAKVR